MQVKTEWEDICYRYRFQCKATKTKEGMRNSQKHIEFKIDSHHQASFK